MKKNLLEIWSPRVSCLHLIELGGMPQTYTPVDVYTMLRTGELQVSHSARRKKTVSITRSGNTWVLVAPQHYDPRMAIDQITRLINRVSAKSGKLASDDDLLAQTLEINRRYFDDGVEPQAVVWVTNQNARWASCDTATGTIRVSHRLKYVPHWVLTAILVHELAHLREANHGTRFKALTNRYERTSDAQIYLEGFSRGIAFASEKSG